MKYYKFWINTKQTLMVINTRDRNTYINNDVLICKYVWSYLKQINKVIIYVIDIFNLYLRDWFSIGNHDLAIINPSFNQIILPLEFFLNTFMKAKT